MPFIQRQVSPVFLAKGDPQGVDSLADGNIIVLTNIIHQLSDLSDHATDIINNITVQCENINHRTDTIVNRVKNVAATINDIPTDVKVDASITEDPYRGVDNLDGQLFTSSTRPQSMLELYDRADGLPNFDLLQPYRDDDLIIRNFYSNPNYFLELWKKEFEEATIAERQKRKEQRRARKEAKKGNKKPKRKVHNFTKIETHAERLQKKYEKEGKIFILSKALSKEFNDKIEADINSVVGEGISTESNVDPSLVRKSLHNPAVAENYENEVIVIPPIQRVEDQAQTLNTAQTGPPPAPPPCPSPAPPPAPPTPVDDDNKQQPHTNKQSLSVSEQLKMGVELRKTEPVKAVNTDTRSDLLTQIRKGRALKKVQIMNDNVVKKRASGIAGIFENAMNARRLAMESDTEDDDDSDDDQDWDQ